MKNDGRTDDREGDVMPLVYGEPCFTFLRLPFRFRQRSMISQKVWAGNRDSLYRDEKCMKLSSLKS